MTRRKWGDRHYKTASTLTSQSLYIRRRLSQIWRKCCADRAKRALPLRKNFVGGWVVLLQGTNRMITTEIRVGTPFLLDQVHDRICEPGTYWEALDMLFSGLHT